MISGPHCFETVLKQHIIMKCMVGSRKEGKELGPHIPFRVKDLSPCRRCCFKVPQTFQPHTGDLVHESNNSISLFRIIATLLFS